MSGYRDDLAAAKQRIAFLEERLRERDDELSELRDRRYPAEPSKPGRLPQLAIGALLGLVGVAFIGAHAPSAPTHPAGDGATEPAPPEPLPNGPAFSSPRLPSSPADFPAARLPPGTEALLAPPPLAERPSECEPRRHPAAGLPPGSRVLRFDNRRGGNCCRGLSMFDSTCPPCADLGSLAEAGIESVGTLQYAPSGLRIERRLRLELRRPVHTLSVGVSPSIMGIADRGHIGAVTMRAHDERGRLVDVAYAEFPTFLRPGDSSKGYPSPVLQVQACREHETLGTVELELSEPSMRLIELAIHPAPEPR